MPTLADLERTWLTARCAEQAIPNTGFLSNDDMWLAWLRKVAPAPGIGTIDDLSLSWLVAQGVAKGSLNDTWVRYLKQFLANNPAGTLSDLRALFYASPFNRSKTWEPTGAADATLWTPTRTAITYSTAQFNTAPGSYLSTVNNVSFTIFNDGKASEIVLLGGAKTFYCEVWVFHQAAAAIRIAVGAQSWNSVPAILTSYPGAYVSCAPGVWRKLSTTLPVTDPTGTGVSPRISFHQADCIIGTQIWYDSVVLTTS